jgi:hypothetical protein
MNVIFSPDFAYIWAVVLGIAHCHRRKWPGCGGAPE